MKKIITVLILTIVMIVAVSVESFGEEDEDITVMGITLGKSLEAVGTRECRIHPSIKGIYDSSDKNCYQIRDTKMRDYRSCFTQVVPDLSFYMIVYVLPLDMCDRHSPIQRIEGTFNSHFYEKVLNLLISKFGQPQKTGKRVLQNRIGAKFEQIISIWNIKGHIIDLANITDKVDRGAFIITHRDKIRRDAEKSGKEFKSDRDKF